MVFGVPCSLCVLVIFQKPRNVGETTKGVIESLSPIWGEDRVVQIWAYNQPFKQLLCFTNIVLSCNPRSQASPVCMKNSRVKPGDEANVSRVKPGDEANVSRVKPGDEANVSRVKPGDEANVSRVKPGDEANVSRVKPGDEANVITVSRVKPGDEANVSRVKPGDEANVSRVKPGDEANVSRVKPGDEANVTTVSMYSGGMAIHTLQLQLQGNVSHVKGKASTAKQTCLSSPLGPKEEVTRTRFYSLGCLPCQLDLTT